MRLYLAAPFFTKEQLLLVEALEQLILSEPHYVLYSPRQDGVLASMAPAERATAAKQIFQTNCNQIMKADLILAVIDGRDTGVIWELGYAYAKGVPIITYTDQDFGLNVMLKYSVVAHVKGIGEALQALRAIAKGNWPHHTDTPLHPVVI